MADSVETVMQGLRSAAEGLTQFGQNRRASRAAEAQQAEKDSKAEAEKARQERLTALGIKIDELSEEASNDPDFDHAALSKALSESGFNREALKEGDPAVYSALADLRAIADNNAKNKRSTNAQAISAEKAKKREAKEDETQARAGRTEVYGIGEKHSNADETKATTKVRQAYNRIEAATEGEPNGLKDIAAVTAFLKSIDEGSTVRETEFKTTADAKSFWARETKTDEDGNLTTKNGVPIPSFIAQAIQKFNPDKKGAFLLPEQREALRDSAEESYRRQLQQQVPIDEKYKKQATEAGAKDLSSIIPRFAAEDLKALDARKTERTKRAAAKEKEDSLKLDKTGSGVPKKKRVGRAWFKAAYDMNLKAATPAIQADEVAAGRKFTDEEKQKIIIDALDKRGYEFDPNLE